MKTQLQDFDQLKTLTFKGKEIITLIPADMHAHEVMCEQGGKDELFCLRCKEKDEDYWKIFNFMILEDDQTIESISEMVGCFPKDLKEINSIDEVIFLFYFVSQK